MAETRRDRILVIDIEKTCWEDSKYQKENSEIIELGVVELNFLTETYRKKTYLIKPIKSEVSKYCEELTTITKELLDKEGVSFLKAIKLLKKDFAVESTVYAGWGDDNKDIETECFKYKIDTPFKKEYYDIGLLYSFYKKLGSKKIKLEKALKNEGINFEGTPHRGVDDAYNTAKLLFKILK